MKYVFLVLLGLLVMASVLTARRMPEVESEVPVLYWVTDPNPARKRQVDTFHRWLEKHGHPPMELRVDSANNQVAKMIIQGVSGVAGDVMDIGPGGLHYFHAVGLLEDVTDAAQELGFDPRQTYPAMESEITLQGRQYLFPCNVFVYLYWVNLDTFARYGMPPPPQQWTLETFEQIGREFVARANPPGQRERVFFAADVDLMILRRSLGVSRFNETLTRCVLDDQRNVEVLRRVYKWTYEDRLLPSAADRTAFSTETGYGGATLQLFYRGNYAMFRMGRYALIQLRQFGPMNLAVSQPPYAEFPNTLTGTRAAAVYHGGQNRDLAKYFLAFLASEDYNHLIVDDADALPPNPLYTRSEAFLRPPDYPGEWEVHAPFAEAAQTIAIPADHSPFVLPADAGRHEQQAFDALMAGRSTPEQSARQAAERINDEIQRMLAADPSLRPRYEALLERQRLIEQRLAEGRKVPLEWIENPFHRRYYQFRGWVE